MRTTGFRVSLALFVCAVACTTPSSGGSDDVATSGPMSGDTSGTGADTSATQADVTTGAPTVACDDPQAALETIFAQECSMMACHDSAAAAGLDLSAPDWIDQLVGQASTQCDGGIRVVPGDPQASLLYEKAAGPTDCGESMPPGGSLPGSDVECIATWISQLDPSSCETCGGDTCIDLESSAQHGGACDSACPPGLGCSGGTCACPSGTQACDGACVDIMADGSHCGGCGRACDDGLVCNAGACASDCGTLTECSGGCVDIQAHPLHCGGCDLPCTGGAQCGTGSCACPGDPIGYADAIEPIFVEECTAMGCHGSAASQEDLDLSAGEGYAELVGIASAQCDSGQLVVPGDPAASYLLNKLQGVDLCFGTKMPKMGSLPAADISAVAQWICHGALP